MASVPGSLTTLLRGQPRFLAKHFDVVLVTSPGLEVEEVVREEGVRVEEIPLTRQITPQQDLRSLRALAALMKRERPAIVHTYTPKAGLLGMAAAWMARVPNRFHSVVGMPLIEAQGARRAVLAVSERMTYAFATRLFSNSVGLREYMHEHLTRRPVEVICNGSINGLDCDHFSPLAIPPSARSSTRKALDIPERDVVFLFVGRIVKDKGVTELTEAFAEVHARHEEVTLVLVGDEEAALDPLPEATRTMLSRHPKVRRAGFVRDVRPLLAIADVFVLPSYREGLPNSLLEAGSMGVPIVATDINGCNEIVEDGSNGLLVPKKETAALRDAMLRLVEDVGLREKLASGARVSIATRFSQERFHAALLATYNATLAMEGA